MFTRLMRLDRGNLNRIQIDFYLTFLIQIYLPDLSSRRFRFKIFDLKFKFFKFVSKIVKFDPKFVEFDRNRQFLIKFDHFRLNLTIFD